MLTVVYPNGESKTFMNINHTLPEKSLPYRSSISGTSATDYRQYSLTDVGCPRMKTSVFQLSTTGNCIEQGTQVKRTKQENLEKYSWLLPVYDINNARGDIFS